MNVYILNQVGKIIYVRIRALPSERPGIVNEMVFELHAKKPSKTKETIVVWRIAHGDSDWLQISQKNVCVRIANKLGWVIDAEELTSDKGVIFKLKPLN